VTQDPEDFVTNLGLHAIDGQHHAALGTQQGPQTLGAGAGQGPEFIVAIEQVGNGPLGDHDPAGPQCGVNLRDAAVFDVTEVADQSDDVETELVMRQGEMGLGLGSVGLMEARARGVGASPEMKGQSNDAVQSGKGAKVVVSGPELLSTFGAVGDQ